MGSLSACRSRRVANRAWIAGGTVGSASAGGDDGPSEAVYGAQMMLAGADTNDDQTFYGRVDIATGGGGGNGMFEQRLDLQYGFAAFDAPHHLFARAGIHEAIEVNSVNRYLSFELPTLFFGYQYHGTSTKDSLHFDIGPRLSLAWAGQASAEGRDINFVAAPGVGGGVSIFGELLFLEGSAMTYFDDQRLFVLRGTACISLLGTV
ncbi:MAG: hypothetical protein AAGF12_28270, partial [Myxococcota bacterium]